MIARDFIDMLAAVLNAMGMPLEPSSLSNIEGA